MVRIRRRAKKLFHLATGDGGYFTILDAENDEQNGTEVFHVRSGGAGFVLIIVAALAGAVAGYVAYSGVGAFFGGFGGFAVSLFLVGFLHMGSNINTIPVPAGAALWPPQKAMVSGKCTLITIRNYDRFGRLIEGMTDSLSQSMRENEDYQRFIVFLRNQINMLNYNLREGQKSSEEITKDYAAALAKLGEAVSKFRPASYSGEKTIVRERTGEEQEERQV